MWGKGKRTGVVSVEGGLILVMGIRLLLENHSPMDWRLKTSPLSLPP